MISLGSEETAERIANRELRAAAVPVITSITLTETAATAIRGEYIVIANNGSRIRYRIGLQVPDETNGGTVTLYLIPDRVLGQHEQ